MFKKSIICVLSVLFALMVLGAKSCEVNTKADVMAALPEILEVAPDLVVDANKFDIEKYSGTIALTTYDNMGFLDAIKKLKTETPMNKPVLIIYGEDIYREGELTTEQPVDEVIAYTGGKLWPYISIIYIRDGWWVAREFDAAALFANAKKKPISLNGTQINAEDKVKVTEYAYSNEAVYKINGWSNLSGILSYFNKTSKGGEAVKGDGSMPDDIISAFDQR